MQYFPRNDKHCCSGYESWTKIYIPKRYDIYSPYNEWGFEWFIWKREIKKIKNILVKIYEFLWSN